LETPVAISAQPVADGAQVLAVGPITARAGGYYRNTRYVMAALTIVMGFWFGYDGFVHWPDDNLKIADLRARLQQSPEDSDLRTQLKGLSPHSDTDIKLQRILAFALPPLGLALLGWALYNSRGAYRLENDVLYIPGHPPVPLASIRELDQRSWDRKGIAVVKYVLTDGRSGLARLDDFVYDRQPTDQIYDRIKAHLLPPVAPTAAIPVEPPATCANG
jgi:hypothetical protein